MVPGLKIEVADGQAGGSGRRGLIAIALQDLFSPLFQQLIGAAAAPALHAQTQQGELGIGGGLALARIVAGDELEEGAGRLLVPLQHGGDAHVVEGAGCIAAAVREEIEQASQRDEPLAKEPLLLFVRLNLPVAQAERPQIPARSAFEEGESRIGPAVLCGRTRLFRHSALERDGPDIEVAAAVR